MHRRHNISIAQRHLNKNKKYYSYRTIRKDKQNIISHDLSEIIEKFKVSNQLPLLPKTINKRIAPISVIQALKNHSTSQKSKLGMNSVHFFQQDQQQVLTKKELKKEVLHYISKMRKPFKSKCSLYQQYLLLSQQTNDYLEYYLTNFTGQEIGKATQLLKQEGKTIILLILRKKYSCFQTNDPGINNRIFLSFNLNPMNDFQFVSWEKFMKIRKLISGDFNRKDCTDFINGYFFIDPKKTITGRQFWLIFSSVFRKLNAVIDHSHLQILLNRVKQSLKQLIPDQKVLNQQQIKKVFMQEPLFIWNQFVALTFL